MLRDSITIAEAAEGRPLKHYEVSQYWSAKAHAYIAGHPSDWLRLMGRKFVNFWNSYQYDDLSLVALFSQMGLLVPGLRFGLVAALGLPGLLLVLAAPPAGRVDRRRGAAAHGGAHAGLHYRALPAGRGPGAAAAGRLWAVGVLGIS